MEVKKVKIAFFVVAFIGLFQANVQAEMSKERQAVIQQCFDKANICSAQCEGLSNQNDQVEKGFFSDDITSPRERCKKVCEKPCDRYKTEIAIEVFEQLRK